MDYFVLGFVLFLAALAYAPGEVIKIGLGLAWLLLLASVLYSLWRLARLAF